MSSTQQLPFQASGNSNNDTNGGTAAATSIDITTSSLVEAAFEPGASPRKLAFALSAVGFLTLVMAMATALYKPPQGVVFQRRRLAYYLTLAGILAAGIAEVATAFWLTRRAAGGGQGRRGLARAVLCCSLLPLVVVVALGGFAVLVKS
ncbi:hypothetical protein ACP4OV_022023 [Aristida adscensionis]